MFGRGGVFGLEVFLDGVVGCKFVVVWWMRCENEMRVFVVYVRKRECMRACLFVCAGG